MMRGNWGWGTGMGFGYGGGMSLGGPSSQNPENILKERYAKGGISREEYLNMLSDMKTELQQ